MTKRCQKNYTEFTYETEMIKADNDIADKLVVELQLCFVGSARYHVDGAFYNLPLAYPFVLFDLYGYVVIQSSHELKCKADVKKKVHISKGIHNLQGYKGYKFVPECLKEVHERRKIEKEKLDKSYQSFRDIMGLAIKSAGTGSLQRIPTGYR